MDKEEKGTSRLCLLCGLALPQWSAASGSKLSLFNREPAAWAGRKNGVQAANFLSTPFGSFATSSKLARLEGGN